MIRVNTLVVLCLAINLSDGRHVASSEQNAECAKVDCYHPTLESDKSQFIPKYFEELNSEYWRTKARNFVSQQRSKQWNTKKAKNVILFLGDGMSMVTQAATRVYMGGEERELFFEKFPYVAMSKTYCVDSQVADSACTSTAYLTGVKANIGTIGVNGNRQRYSCVASENDKDHVNSIGVWALAAGKDVGLVTTTRVTHASPTGLFGHIADRYWETDAKILEDGCDPSHIQDLTEQLVFGEPGKRLKVIFGGGRRTFLNKTVVDEEGNPGFRTDGKNLIEDWKKMEGMGRRTYVWNKAQLKELDAATTDQVLGLFETNHCPYQLEIDEGNLTELKPSLSEMVDKAIEVLSKSSNGFFLFVEGGRIDLAHHSNNARYALEETVQFAKAVELATKKLNLEETLIVVTADHSHVVSYAGYSERSKDILGTTDEIASDGMRYMTLSYGSGMGYYNHFNKTTNQRVSPDLAMITSEPRRHPATVPLIDDTHGGDDVAIYAKGPYAHLFEGVIEQNVIPHIMAYAAYIGDGLTACP